MLQIDAALSTFSGYATAGQPNHSFGGNVDPGSLIQRYPV